MSDFNADMMLQTTEMRFLHNFIDIYNLNLISSNLTYHSGKSHTWLDLVIVSDLDEVSNLAKSGTPFLSRHELITFDYTSQFKPNDNLIYKRRDFANFSNVNFLTMLRNTLSNPLPDSLTFEGYLDYVKKALLLSLDTHAPYRIFKSIRPPLPWIFNDKKSQLKFQKRLKVRLK